MVGINIYPVYLGQRAMPLYMLHRSMLLGKLLALDLPLEHEGRIHQAIDHEQKTLLNHTHENPGMDLARGIFLLLPWAMDLSLLALGLSHFLRYWYVSGY